jgi:hypothetical protein
MRASELSHNSAVGASQWQTTHFWRGPLTVEGEDMRVKLARSCVVLRQEYRRATDDVRSLIFLSDGHLRRILYGLVQALQARP